MSGDTGSVAVSVIIPTYNRASFLPECIDSVLDQTFANYEIVVVDDCSTDSTQDVMRHYTEIDERIRYYHLGSNVGQAHARNFGIMRSKGELIAFLDSDDRWLPAKLARQMELVGNLHLDSIGSQVINEPLRSHCDKVGGFVVIQKNLLRQVLSGSCSIPMSTIVVKRSVLINSCFVQNAIVSVPAFGDLKFGADHFEILIAVSKSRFLFLQEPLARYIHHDHNISNRQSFYLQYSMFLMFRLRCFKCTEYPMVIWFSTRWFLRHLIRRFVVMIRASITVLGSS